MSHLLLSAEQVAAFVVEVFPESQAFGARLEELRAGWLAAHLPFRPDRLRPGGTISGPTLMTLADVASYWLILGHVGREALAVTTSLHMDFLRRPPPSDLCAEAELLKLGRRLAVVRVSIRSTEFEEPVAHAVVTYSIPR